MKKQKANVSGISKNLSTHLSKQESEKPAENSMLYNRRIGISVADSEDYEKLGFSKLHQKDMTIEITRYLLMNGAHLIYGGDLRSEGYTAAFSELAYQYGFKQDYDKMLYTNFFSWPIYLDLTEEKEAELKASRAQAIRVPPPAEIPADLLKVGVKPDTPEHRYYWGKSLARMRSEMIGQCDARIFIGGKIANYKGLYPGIIEEAYLTLQAKQPFYVIGLFGGAARYIIRAIKGESEKKLEQELIDAYPSLTELYDYTENREKKRPELKLMFAAFKKLGMKGLSRLNKLSDDENEILFETLHFHEIIYYSLVGLKKALK